MYTPSVAARGVPKKTTEIPCGHGVAGESPQVFVREALRVHVGWVPLQPELLVASQRPAPRGDEVEVTPQKTRDGGALLRKAVLHAVRDVPDEVLVSDVNSQQLLSGECVHPDQVRFPWLEVGEPAPREQGVGLSARPILDGLA